MSIDGRFWIIKIERWVGAGQLQVCFIEGANGSNVLPVAIEIKAVHFMRTDRLWDDLAPKIIMPQVIGKQRIQHVCFKHVDSHRAQERAFWVITAYESILDFGIFWFFNKIRELTICLALQDSQ